MIRRSVKMGLCLLLVTLMFFSSISSASTSLEDPGMSSDEENQAEIEAELAAAESDSDSSLTSDSSNEDESSDEDSLTSDSSTDDEEEDKEDNSDLVESSQESGSSGITDDSGGDTQDNSDLVDPGEDTGSSGITDDSGGDTEDDLTQNDVATASEDAQTKQLIDTSTAFGSSGISPPYSLSENERSSDDGFDKGNSDNSGFDKGQEGSWDDTSDGSSGEVPSICLPENFEPGDIIIMDRKQGIPLKIELPGEKNDHAVMYLGTEGSEIKIAHASRPDVHNDTLRSIYEKGLVESYTSDSFVFAHVKDATDSQRNSAIKFVLDRVEDENAIYQFELFDIKEIDWEKENNPDVDNRWYCSEVVWAAWYNAGIDIDRNGWETADLQFWINLIPWIYNKAPWVTPWEIKNDDDIEILDGGPQDETVPESTNSGYNLGGYMGRIYPRDPIVYSDYELGPIPMVPHANTGSSDDGNKPVFMSEVTLDAIVDQGLTIKPYICNNQNIFGETELLIPDEYNVGFTRSLKWRPENRIITQSFIPDCNKIGAFGASVGFEGYNYHGDESQIPNIKISLFRNLNGMPDVANPLISRVFTKDQCKDDWIGVGYDVDDYIQIGIDGFVHLEDISMIPIEISVVPGDAYYIGVEVLGPYPDDFCGGYTWGITDDLYQDGRRRDLELVNGDWQWVKENTPYTIYKDMAFSVWGWDILPEMPSNPQPSEGEAVEIKTYTPETEYTLEETAGSIEGEGIGVILSFSAVDKDSISSLKGLFYVNSNDDDDFELAGTIQSVNGRSELFFTDVNKDGAHYKWKATSEDWGIIRATHEIWKFTTNPYTEGDTDIDIEEEKSG